MQILLILFACHSPGNIRGPGSSDTDTDSGADTQDPIDTEDPGPCPGMVAIETFCIDPYEAWLNGQSPFEVPQSGVATTGPGSIPQGYISGDVAELACIAAGKRLCTLDEWMRACQGPKGWTYPYGNSYDADACNVSRAQHPVISLFGSNTNWSPEQMNNPAINQQDDTVDAGGANADCVSAEGVYDLHGNLHEWIDDPNGTFKGGFYADASINGAGCTYTTTAHSSGYHDYSTGFRCCSDLP